MLVVRPGNSVRRGSSSRRLAPTRDGNSGDLKSGYIVVGNELTEIRGWSPNKDQDNVNYQGRI